MTAPSIQLASSMSGENIAASVHAFETSVGAGASFAEQLGRAVQSSPLETQPSDSRSTLKQASDAAPQTQRTQAVAHPAASQTKQNSGASGKSNASGRAQNSDTVHKDDEPRHPANTRSKDSRQWDNSRNSGRHQAGDEEDSANSKSPFAQAVAQSAASQSTSSASSATQPSAAGAQPSDVSIPAALLALLQAAQNPAQAVAVQTEVTSSNDPNVVQTDSSSTDAECAAPSNLFQSLNFGTSNAAYQAALTNFQTSVPAVQSTSSSSNGTASQPSASAGSANSLSSADQQASAPSSDSEAASENSNCVPPSAPSPQVSTSAVSTDSTANSVAGASASAATNAPHASPSTNRQQAETQQAPAVKSSQAETTDPANFIKNLKLDAGQHEAAKSTLEALTATAAKAKTEPVAAELQQAVTGVTVTNHVSSPALSGQASANASQTLTAGQDSGSPAVSTTQGSAGWTDDSTGDSAEDDASAQASGAFQGANGSKTSGSAMEFLPSSAFTGDAVGGVAPAAVHAVAAGTLESNTGLDNAAFKTPEAVPQNLNTAAQEKAFAAWQSVSAQIGRVVNTATLNALQNGTEMRVQLRTDAFGSMDIRATLEGGKVGAAIGVESAEAHNALLSQLPALQQSLNERQVQLDQISVVSSYGQSGTDSGTGSGKQNGDPTPSSGYHQQASGPEPVSEPLSAPVTEAWQPATSGGRLSVQA